MRRLGEIITRGGLAAAFIGSAGASSACVNESAAAVASPYPTMTSEQALAAQADHSNLINYLNDPSHRFGQNEANYQTVVFTDRVSRPAFVLTEEGRKVRLAPFFSDETELPQERLELGLVPRPKTEGAFIVATQQILPDGSQIGARWLGKNGPREGTATFILLETTKDGQTIMHTSFLEIPTQTPPKKQIVL